MKNRSQRKPAGPWGSRLEALINACGWRQAEWSVHFGCSAQAVRRVMFGGRPKVKFLLQLQKLETAYSEELEALAQGLIATRGRKRYCWIIARPGRPEDLRDLG